MAFNTNYSILALVFLAGCGGSGDGYIIGPNATFSQAVQAETELVDRLIEIYNAEGPTDYVDLPSGSANYVGVVDGFIFEGEGPEIGYLADLTMSADFNNDQIDGDVTNFVTNLPGFENPNGSIDVSGTISSDAGLAAMGFTGSGLLTQGANQADYIISTTTGGFAGTNAQIAYGDVIADFEWVSGANSGTTSLSDGYWNTELAGN